MKKFLILTAFLIGVIGFAQERKNTESESVITRQTIKDNQGTKTLTKTESQTKNQRMRLAEEDRNKTNQTVIMDPIEVNTDISYDFDGNRFQFLSQEDKEGYRLMTVRDNVTDKEYALIKPSSQPGYYIISKEGQSSFGYFDEEGNFVIESYDSSKDRVVTEVFKINRN